MIFHFQNDFRNDDDENYLKAHQLITNDAIEFRN